MEKKDCNFKTGQLIVPGNHLEAAFVYKNKDQLVDGVDYHVATDREYINFYKYENQSPNFQGVTSFQQYKEENSNYENNSQVGGADEDFADFEKRKSLYEKVFGNSGF